MTYPDFRDPHARALRDYFDGATSATIIVHNSLGVSEELPVSVFFREHEAFFPFERVALEHCHGRVLDVGAGTGVHSLYLQDRGQVLCAIDLLPEAVEIMRARGVQDANVANIFGFASEPFDTILSMMNGTGLFGTLRGLGLFLSDATKLVKPGGQILLDSGPARLVGDADEAAEEVSLPADGSYPGEVWIELEYLGVRGPPFRELHVDADTLSETAVATGWSSEIVFHDRLGGYVARLTRA